jgi:hypothetical protein
MSPFVPTSQDIDFVQNMIRRTNHNALWMLPDYPGLRYRFDHKNKQLVRQVTGGLTPDEAETHLRNVVVFGCLGWSVIDVVADGQNRAIPD